jgi:phage terminase large subunit
MRRLFPRMWFDGERCAAGLEGLAAYHEKRDDKREVGLGPEHDWASHPADAAGLMAISYEEPRLSLKPTEERERIQIGGDSGSGGGWMGA